MKATLFVPVLVVVALVAGTCVCQTPPPLPNIPTQFNSTVHLEFFLGVLQAFNGRVIFDAESEQSRFDVAYFFGGQTQYGLYSKLQFTSKGVFFTTNGACRQWVGKWEDPFDWLEDDDTMYSGKTMVNGRSCDLWTNTDSHGWVESLAAQGNTPVQWNVSNHYLNFFESITYGTDFKPGPSPPSVFSVAPSCYNGGAICPGGTIANITMIRYHPTDDWQLDDHNTADALGDAVFLCATLGNNITTSDQLITAYEVQVNTSWGMYAKCNSVCRGGHNFTVGRAASAGVKKNGGQCVDNSDTGNWYSMPSTAKCAPNQPVGGGQKGCAWKVNYRFKTINANCLNQQGFSKACNADSTWPLAKPAQILITALTSTDPKEGGCPAVPPPPSSSDAMLPQHPSFGSQQGINSLSRPKPGFKNAVAKDPLSAVLEAVPDHPGLNLAYFLAEVTP